MEVDMSESIYLLAMLKDLVQRGASVWSGSERSLFAHDGNTSVIVTIGALRSGDSIGVEISQVCLHGVSFEANAMKTP